MEFKFYCPHCGQHIAATTELVGIQSTCPNCSKRFTVPAPDIPDLRRSAPPPLPATPVAPPPANKPTPEPTYREQQTKPKAKKGSSSYVAIVFGILVILGLRSCFSGDSRETKLKTAITQNLESNPQQLFNVFHPIGTAKSVKVHSIQLYNNGADATFTIYWQGPIRSDGYTKIVAHYDADVQRWTRNQILATNGITNAEANEAAFNIGYEIGRSLFDNR